jgi:hypothetical protein
MRRAWMMIMQIKREFMAQLWIGADGFLEKLFLDIAREVRPKPKGSLSEGM